MNIFRYVYNIAYNKYLLHKSKQKMVRDLNLSHMNISKVDLISIYSLYEKGYMFMITSSYVEGCEILYISENFCKFVGYTQDELHHFQRKMRQNKII